MKLNKYQKEALWWLLGVILMVILISMVFVAASAGLCHAQEVPRGPDFVGRSLDKTIVVQPNGHRTVVPSPRGAGQRVETIVKKSKPAAGYESRTGFSRGKDIGARSYGRGRGR